MIKVKILLKEDIVSRKAFELIEQLQKVQSDIFIIKDERSFNGKSLVGILNNNLRYNTTILIKMQEENYQDFLKVKEIFKNYGQEVE